MASILDDFRSDTPVRRIAESARDDWADYRIMRSYAVRGLPYVNRTGQLLRATEGGVRLHDIA